MPLTELLCSLPPLRALETAAAANPGHERSRDHDTSVAYDAYAAAWRALEARLWAMDVTGWTALRDWARANDDAFGDATWAGVHGAPMAWDPKARSLSRALLTAISRRARETAALNPDFWVDARVAELLSDDKWLDFPEVFASVLTSLAAVQPGLLRAVHPEPLTSRLRDAGFPPDLVAAPPKEA